MYIAYIELTNIKSYESSGRIDFARGINAISGKNGAGKSTILEAIGFALFDARTHTTENFIREGCKKGEIIVGFVDAVDERLYEVVRGVPGIPYIYDPELKRKLVTGKDDVYSWIKEHLLVSPVGDLEALFQDTIGVQQGLLTAPFLQTPRERKFKFDKLLQVEEYDNVYKWLAASEKDLGTLISNESNEIEYLKGKLSDLPELQEGVKSLRKEIKETSVELNMKDIEVKKVHSKKQDLDITKELIDKLSTSIKTQKDRIVEFSTQHEEAAKELIIAKKAQEIIKSSLESFKAFKDCEDKLISLETQRKERDEQAKLENKIDKNISENSVKTEEIKKQLRDIDQADAELKKLTPTLEEFHENQDNLKVAEDKLIIKQGDIKRLEDEINRLNELNQELEKVQIALISRTKLENDKSDLNNQIQTLNNNKALENANISQYKVQNKQFAERKALLAETESTECPVCLSPLGPDKISELEKNYSDELIDLEQKLTSSQKLVTKYDLDIKKLNADKVDLDLQLNLLPSHSRDAEIKEKIKQQNNEVSKWENKKNTYKGLDELLLQLRDKKSEFGDIVSKYSICENIAGKRLSVEDKLDSLIKSGKQFQQEKMEITKTLNSFYGLDETIVKTSQNKENFRAGHDQYLSNIKTAEQYEKHLSRKDEIQKKIDKEMEENISAIENLKELQLTYDSKLHEQLIEKFINLNTDLGGLRTKEIMLKGQLGEKEKKVQELSPLVNKLKACEGELKQLNSVSDVLKFVRKTIREAGPYIVKQLLQVISDGADRIFGEILNDFTARLTWTEDYEIQIEHQGYIREFSQLSGGEKMTAALAVRLALLREMSEIRIAFFDEPTSNLDDERKNNLADQMTKIKGFEQLFIISHDDTFEHQTDNVLHINKENEISYVTGG